MKTKSDITALGAFVIWLCLNDPAFYKEFELKFKTFCDDLSKKSKEVKSNG